MAAYFIFDKIQLHLPADWSIHERREGFQLNKMQLIDGSICVTLNSNKYLYLFMAYSC